MKTYNPLPDTVKKPCGTKPGQSNERYVVSGDGDPCSNPAGFVVTIDGVELLVCGTHRETVWRNDDLFEEVVTEGNDLERPGREWRP